MDFLIVVYNCCYRVVRDARDVSGRVIGVLQVLQLIAVSRKILRGKTV